MAETTTTESGIGAETTKPGISVARLARAVGEDMDVDEVDPATYDVTHNGSTYQVKLESGHCECDDCLYRGIGCKHAQRAALVHCYRSGVTTQFVARVVGHAREQDCPNGHPRLCDGPAGPRLPCPGCMIDDEWTVWTAVVTEDR